MKKWFESNKNWIIIVVVILITAIVVGAMMAEGLPTGTAKLLPVKDGGAIPPGWEPASLTAKLFHAIDGYSSDPEREIAFAQFNVLNDNQMIEVYNWWLLHYANETSWFQKHGTLTYAIRNEWYKDNEGVKALGNLERLQLQ